MARNGIGPAKNEMATLAIACILTGKAAETSVHLRQ
jgi:hypothetical protein